MEAPHQDHPLISIMNEFFIFDELEKNRSVESGPLNTDSLIKYLYNAANDTNLTGFYVDANDNLTFKSLTEWSDSIKRSGNSIILPHEAVVITDSSPVHKLCTVKDDASQEDGNRNFLTLQVLPQSSNNNNPDGSSLNQKSEHKRLVIKLSRCSSSGKNWKPVRILSDHSLEEPEARESVSRTKSISGK